MPMSMMSIQQLEDMTLNNDAIVARPNVGFPKEQLYKVLRENYTLQLLDCSQVGIRQMIR